MTSDQHHHEYDQTRPPNIEVGPSCGVATFAQLREQVSQCSVKAIRLLNYNEVDTQKVPISLSTGQRWAVEVLKAFRGIRCPMSGAMSRVCLNTQNSTTEMPFPYD